MSSQYQEAEVYANYSLAEFNNSKVLELKGIGVEIEEEEEISQPFDPTKIKIDARQLTIDLVLTRIKFQEIELTPDFQRESNIWNDTAKSRLIESMLIRIPLPAFYIDATNEDKWVVIDGQQRLTAIKTFVLDEEKLSEKDKFRLINLEFLKQFIGKTFSQLPRSYQRRINETQITVYLIEKGTPPEVKFNIFRRINTGGLPLSSQEIRHALNQGASTRFLEKLSKSEEFKEATANGISDNRMSAREVILRFLAFKVTHPSEYNAQELDTFLNEAMAMINQMSAEEIGKLESDFIKAMSAASSIFGNDAFRKRSDRKAPRSQVNKALFEAWSVNLSNLDRHEISLLVNRKDLLVDNFIDLMNKDLLFNTSISQGTGDIRKVKYRFESIKQIIRMTLDS